MSGVYSQRLLTIDLPEGGSVSAAVPAGEVWIVKSIDVVTSTTGASAVASTNGILWWASGSISAAGGSDGHAAYSGFSVLQAGDTLAVSTSVDVSGQVSGYALTAS
jgi:hypothetical protein